MQDGAIVNVECLGTCEGSIELLAM